jgi:hypothetical protein
MTILLKKNLNNFTNNQEKILFNKLKKILRREELRIYISAIICIIIISCSNEENKNAASVVQVDDKILTQGEIEENIPQYLNEEDSLLAAEYYIRVWINDHLMYDLAQKNIADKKAIDRLVENYRKSLIIYQYQEKLINEKLSKEISNETLQNYFDNNRNKFKLDKPLAKGVFLKTPKSTSQIDKIRGWYKSITPSSLDNLEKFSKQNASIYDYFDKWIDMNELMNKLPIKRENPVDMVKSHKFFEQEDDNYFYFLHVSDYLLPGENAPFEYAKAMVRELLINQKKIDFLRKTEEDLYEKALNSGRIKFFNE